MTRHLVPALVLTLLAGTAAAHAGHGFGGPHWHASDLFGPVLLAVAGAATWWSRRK